MQHILSLVRRCVEDYNMIEAGDTVAVGVSGGKDSVLTLAALAKLPLEDPGAGYLAAVYLGAVIAGGGTDKLDPEMAAQGLLRLLEAMRRDVRDVAVICERYYDRSYRRNERYTL